MPPKSKDKKGKQEVPPTGVDYTRRPLVAQEPCDVKPAPRRELPVVSAHHAFEEWDQDALADMDWGTAGAETLFEDIDGRSFLPAKLAARVVDWVRPRDFIATKKGESEGNGDEERLHRGKSAAAGAEGKGKASGGGNKGKAKSPKGKDKAPSFEPVVLEDAAFDEDGNPLPRVVVMAEPTGAVPAGGKDSGVDRGLDASAVAAREETGVLTPGRPGDGQARWSSSGPGVSNRLLPRGFKPGWSKDQRKQIAWLLREQTGNGQQGEQDQERETTEEEPPGESEETAAAAVGGKEKESPPEEAVEGDVEENALPGRDKDGSNASPGYLSDEDIAHLGAPSGDDVDPTMAAIFKAVGQLSPTLSCTGCPLLWEAIYPKTADEVPCYNPCGRYAVKLFAAGRWRKVEVDDCIPLDAARCPVIASSENPLELWPLLISKALYKLYRLGGYGIVQEARAVVAAAAGAASDGSVNPNRASVPGCETADNGDVDDADVDTGDEADAADEADRARFVAFVLHSLAGWIPSVSAGVSADTALLEGTPGLTPDDVYLPTLPPVDEEAEAARERLEERKRRQALFLHKKRRPRKVERKIVSVEERAEVESARLEKMRAVSEKLLKADRREVYVVCMPGKPAYPVLAVCPQLSMVNNAASQRGNSAASAAPFSQQQQPLQCEERAGTAATAGTGTNNTSLQEHEPPRLSAAAAPTTPTPAATVGAEAAGATITTTIANDDENLPLGFLLKWEAPPSSQQHRNRAATSGGGGGEATLEGHPQAATGAGAGGGGDASPGDAGSGERESRVLYGSGGRRRGYGKDDPAAEGTGCASSSSSLPNPACLWLSPREIQLAGGKVVRVLTKVDKTAYADVQYHWKLRTSAEKVETANNATNEKAAAAAAASSKAGKGKAKGKGKDSDKDKDIAAKGKGGKAGAASENGGSTPLPSGEEAGREAVIAIAPPGCVVVEGVAVPKGLEGMNARDPGSPPAIFLLVIPSPRSNPKRSLSTQAQNQETPERDGALSESTPPGGNEHPPEVTVGKGSATVAGNATDMGEGGDGATPAGVTEGEGKARDQAQGEVGGEGDEEKEEEEEEEEEAEILMCLWADNPGFAASLGTSLQGNMSDTQTMVMLQEVLPGGQNARGDFSKPVPGGRVIMRARHDPQHSGLPLTSTSAKVRLTKGGPPRVFRVLLQPGLGCCVGFCCTHDIETGDAGQVWEEAGYSQVTETGKYESARPGEWRVLFRRAFRVTAEAPKIDDEPEVLDNPAGHSEGVADRVPLETSAPETSLEDDARIHGSGSGGGDGDDAGTVATAGSPEQSLGQRSEEHSSPPAALSSADFCFVKAILHLPDEESRPCVSLAFVDEDTGLEMMQPLLHTNAVPLKPNAKGYSVLAVACGRAKAIPKGAWRLQLLSDRPLLPLSQSPDEGGGGSDPSPSPASPRGGAAGDPGEAEGGESTTVVPCLERVVYGGDYVPNKYSRLFRDVLKCVSPLPFAVRLRCSRPGICHLRLKFLDAATGETLRDLRGGHVVQALTVTPPPAPEDESSSPSANEAPAKGGGKDKAKAVAATDKTVAPTATPGNMIVEASLDWSGEVPPHLASELPHYFQPTPEKMPHYSPPPPKSASMVSLGPTSMERQECGNDGAEKVPRGVSYSLCTEDSSSRRSSIAVSTATGPSPSPSSSSLAAAPAVAADRSPEDGKAGTHDHPDATLPPPAGSDKPTEEPLRWWLEIVGGGEVSMAHDTTRVDQENAEVQSWETAEPGRAARAALLWTQREASKVANLGNGDLQSASPSLSAETDPSGKATIAIPCPDTEGFEDWIKARAAAVGVPVALEKERHACRLALLRAPATTGGTVAPSSGSSCSAAVPASGPPPSSPLSPSPAVLIGEEERKQRAEEREALRQATAEFEKKWEADRVKAVEASKERMALQLQYIRGREEKIKEGRLPFLRDRDNIVLDLIAKAEARKEALEEERALLETSSKGSKAKPAKGKAGKK